MGVILRILVLVHVCAVVTVLIAQPQPAMLAETALFFAAWLELPLMTVLLLLFVTSPLLHRLGRGWGQLLVVTLSVLVALLALSWLGATASMQILRGGLWAGAVAWLVLFYFDWLARLRSPALVEAKLMALTARIRPHFLFNALNGVLGVIRSDPKRAEQALEALADVFRAQMRENRELVPLHEELELCGRYLDLEQLRLGERLQCHWQVETSAHHALVPPLILQPLLENAVYHGVEPSAHPQPIRVAIGTTRQELSLCVENAVAEATAHRAGNHMAMDNIRERLLLFFDLEARLTVHSDSQIYRVEISLPLRKAGQFRSG